MLVIRKEFDCAYDLREEFRKFGIDDFKFETYEWLVEHFDSLGEDVELDVIAICCDLEEMTYNEVWVNYGLELEEYDKVELEENYGDDEEELRQETEELMKEKVIEYLEGNTSVLGSDDDIIVFWSF